MRTPICKNCWFFGPLGDCRQREPRVVEGVAVWPETGAADLCSEHVWTLYPDSCIFCACSPTHADQFDLGCECPCHAEACGGTA